MEIRSEILYFGLTFEKFDILDFTDDFLAGVRANFFNSDKEPQVNRCVQLVEDDEYSFIYSMEDNSPLSWKVNKNGRVFQNAEPVDSNTYRVNTYGSDGRVFKRFYYTNNHVWLKSEYLNNELKSVEYILYPSVIDEKDVIVKIHFSTDSTVQSYLYPKTDMPEDGDYSVLAYTENGFLFFNSVPNEKFITKTVIHNDSVNNLGGFAFDSVDFNLNRNLNSTFDITKAEYLTEENGKPFHTFTNVPYIEPVKPEHEDEVKVCEDDEKEPDISIESNGEVFGYFGETDENGKRSGYGRTVTPEGHTAYEGEYENDKRNGFGTFYYKNKTVNYIGNWKDNYRDGFGVGFRGSDGTSHIGKWDKNNPYGIGARFDKDGNFIFLGHYVNGIKQGRGITVDENGDFIISEFVNDEVTASFKLDDLMKNE